jgi:hypothetical protein
MTNVSSLLEIMLLFTAIVIGSIIGAAVQALRNWSKQRRIEEALGSSLKEPSWNTGRWIR